MNPSNDRLNKALTPALLMGVLTNAYILLFQLFVEAYQVIYSPIIGTLIFVVSFFLLKKEHLKPKLVFLITAYTVATEVFIHTCFFGWGSGFYYFMFLLPIVFLLDSTWKTGMTLFFNLSIIIGTVSLWYLFHDQVALYPISLEIESYVHMINLFGTGIIIFVIMVYFSRTIHKKDEALIAANRELAEQNKEISEQHQLSQLLLKEIHHRVKNNLQVISSLMSLQHRSVVDIEVAEVLNESKRRVEAIALIHEKLFTDDKVNRVDFKAYLREIMHSQQIMTPNINCVAESEEITLNIDVAVPLGLIISEMVTNAVKHAFSDQPNPELHVRLYSDHDDFVLIVKDNGKGLPESFDWDNPGSLGTEIIAAFTDQINGCLEYTHTGGATFTLRFQDRE